MLEGMARLNPGDQVVLRSGGILMTVEQVDSTEYGTVRCLYWNGSTIERIAVREDAVRVFCRTGTPSAEAP